MGRKTEQRRGVGGGEGRKDVRKSKEKNAKYLRSRVRNTVRFSGVCSDLLSTTLHYLSREKYEAVFFPLLRGWCELDIA